MVSCVAAPNKNIEKIVDNCRGMFGTNPKPTASPLVSNDHPELDTSELLGIDDTKICQSFIGSPQWTIQIGRFDITTAVTTMLPFRATL